MGKVLIELEAPRAGLTSKFRPPGQPADLLSRPGLTEVILRCVERPLTLICAPAGSGKTTAVAAALSASSYPVAWLSLDEGDDHPATFVRHVVAAVRTQIPGACSASLGLLHLPAQPAPAHAGRVLGEDLAELPVDLVLVLDDYHRLEHRDIHTLVAALLRRPPTPLRLVVTTRDAPRLPLARFRASGELAELDFNDLRFQTAEARAFLERAVGASVTNDEALAVQARVDGWVAGLRLVALAVRNRKESAPLHRVLAERADPNLAAYLWEEVVVQQPAEIQEFLLRTSIVERVCPALGDALMEWGESATDSLHILARLEQIGFFVAAIDDAGEWYRYHHLFSDTLRSRLRLGRSRAEIQAIHGRASAWFARQGQIDEAVQHALAAGDADGAARLVEQNTGAAVDTDRWLTLERWLGLIPAEVVQARPALLLAQAWVAYFRNAWGRIGALLERAEALVAAETERPRERMEALQAEVDLWKAVIWAKQGDGPRTADHAQRAWDRLPAAHALGLAGAYLAVGRQMSGEPEAALAMLHDRRVVELDGHPVAKQRLLVGVAHGQLAAANFPAFEVLARQANELTAPTGYDTAQGWTGFMLGRLHYEWNALEAAHERFAAVVARRDRTNHYPLWLSLQGLALTYEALGRPREAAEIADGLIEQTLAAGGGALEEDARSFRARLALLQGDHESAARWLPLARPRAALPLAFAIEVPAITRARVLIAHGTDASLDEADRWISELLRVGEARHDTLRIVELLALQSLAHRARGEPGEAVQFLARAVALGAPGGPIRTFVDLGPDLASLLVELARSPGHHDYVGRLLAAFSKDRSPTVSTVGPQGPSILVEPLTNREMDIIELLAARYSNKEIAARLHISRHTVTRHTVNIYQKLQATDRRDAVRRARNLGLLT
jgi:LuxR family maltose regulon positive regulatory protein